MSTRFQFNKNSLKIVVSSMEVNPITCVITNFETRKMSIDYADGHKQVLALKEIERVLISDSSIVIYLRENKNEN